MISFSTGIYDQPILELGKHYIDFSLRHILSNRGFISEIGLEMPWFGTYTSTGKRFGCFSTYTCSCSTCFILSILLRITVWPFYKLIGLICGAIRK